MHALVKDAGILFGWMQAYSLGGCRHALRVDAGMLLQRMRRAADFALWSRGEYLDVCCARISSSHFRKVYFYAVKVRLLSALQGVLFFSGSQCLKKFRKVV